MPCDRRITGPAGQAGKGKGQGAEKPGNSASTVAPREQLSGSDKVVPPGVTGFLGEKNRKKYEKKPKCRIPNFHILCLKYTT